MGKNLEQLVQVARDLQVAGVDAVFFGGATVGLHLDRPGFAERPTDDVDCVPLAVDGYQDMNALDGRLAAAGWKHDIRPGKRNANARIAPSGVPVDFVPTYTMAPDDPVVLAHREEVEVAPGLLITIIDPAGMMAAKLAAFRDRGAADIWTSHDLEDLAVLLAYCSRSETSVEAAPDSVKAAIREGWRKMTRDELYAMAAHVDPVDVVERARRLAR